MLSVYGVFKYDDHEYNKNFITNLMDKVEDFPITEKLFNFETLSPEMTSSTIEMKSITSNSNSENQKCEMDISIKFKSPTHLRKNVGDTPIVIKLDRFISIKSPTHTSNFGKICYCIRTFIKPDLYISEKSFEEFRKLLASIKNLSNVQNSDASEYIKNLVFSETEEDMNNSEQMLQLIDKLEDFLQKTVNDPQYFCTFEVLTFLRILRKNRKPMNLFKRLSRRYTQTFELSPLGKLTNLPLDFESKPPLTRKKTPDFLQININLIQNLEVPYADLDSSLIKNFFFKIIPLGYERQATDNQVFYRFLISNLSTNPPKTWEISKPFQCFKQLNEDLEKQTGKEIPFFIEMMPKIINMQKSNEYDFLQRRNDALFNYLKALLQKLTFHGEILYHFIGFDTEKGNPNTPHLMVPFAGPSAYLRNSPLEKQKENLAFQWGFEENDETKQSSFGKSSFGSLIHLRI